MCDKKDCKNEKTLNCLSCIWSKNINEYSRFFDWYIAKKDNI